MSGIERLLHAAEVAGPGERIEYRDRIAAHGATAVGPLRVWLQDKRLSAFAIRTLLKIGEQPTARADVVAALRSVDRRAATAATAKDLVEAISRLGGSGGTRSVRETSPVGYGEWPGSRPVSDLERRFHEDMIDVFRLAGEATRKVRRDGSVQRGYWASYFLRGVRNHGGRDYARQLIHRLGTTAGFERLRSEGHLELTMEALILRPEYTSLFTNEERRIAADRLAEAGRS